VRTFLKSFSCAFHKISTPRWASVNSRREAPACADASVLLAADCASYQAAHSHIANDKCNSFVCALLWLLIIPLNSRWEIYRASQESKRCFWSYSRFPTFVASFAGIQPPEITFKEKIRFCEVGMLVVVTWFSQKWCGYCLLTKKLKVAVVNGFRDTNCWNWLVSSIRHYCALDRFGIAIIFQEDMFETYLFSFEIWIELLARSCH